MFGFGQRPFFQGPRFRQGFGSGFGGGFIIPFTLGALTGSVFRPPYSYYYPYPYYPYYPYY